MIKNRVHHLAIEQSGKIIKMITTHDIMVHQGTSPLYLFREILAQRQIEGLYPLALKVPQVVRSLIEEGAKANNITRMIAVLNDHVLDRLLSLLLEEMGEAPAPWAWLLMGSEGRREQTFKTDQDNAIIYCPAGGRHEYGASRGIFSGVRRKSDPAPGQVRLPVVSGRDHGHQPQMAAALFGLEGILRQMVQSPRPRRDPELHHLF